MIQKKKTVTPKKPFGKPKTEEKKKIVKVVEEDEDDDSDDFDMEEEDFDESGSDLDGDEMDEDVDDDDEEEEEDDEEEDDSDESDSEETPAKGKIPQSKQKKMTVNKKLNGSAKKLAAVDDDDNDDEEEDDDEEGDDSNESDSEETPAKGKTPQLQQNKMPVNKKLNGSAKKLVAENESEDGDDTQAKKTPAKRKIGDAVDDNNSVHKRTKFENNEPEEDMAERDKKSLFVKHLPSDSTEESIKALSKDILAVSLPFRKNPNKKFFYAFAYLRFENEATAEKNYELLQNKTLGGNKLVIDYVGAKSQGRKKAKFENNESEVDKAERDKKSLFVKNLPSDSTEESIKTLSKDILAVRLPFRKNPNLTFTFAYLGFENEAMVEKNYQLLQNQTLGGNELVVDYVGAKSQGRNKTKFENNEHEVDIAERDKKSLFVKNLPLDSTEESVKTLSKDILAVNLLVQKNPNIFFTFAYLNFENEATAEKNYKLLQNQTLGGNKLVVDYVRAKNQDGKVVDNKKLIVKNIGNAMDMKELGNHFEKAIELQIRRREDQSCLAFALFATPNDAADALAKCEKWIFDGEKVQVEYAFPIDDRRVANYGTKAAPFHKPQRPKFVQRKPTSGNFRNANAAPVRLPFGDRHFQARK